MNQIIVVLVAIVAIASKTSALELKCLNSTSHKLVPSSETSLKGEVGLKLTLYEVILIQTYVSVPDTTR